MVPDPAVKKQTNRMPVTPKGTHTHTRLPEGRRKTKVKANVHVYAQHGQKNEDMKRGQARARVYAAAMKRNQVHRDKQ